MGKDIAVVILNWNGIGHLKEFLPSVIQNSNKDIADIYVIDNASTDNSVQYLSENFPSVIIIKNKQNGGFARGYNEGLQHIKSKYYVLLNSDVEVCPNWLEPLYQKLENDNSLGACQPKVLDYKNKLLFEHAGAAGGFIDIYGFPFCRGRIFNSLEHDKQQYNDDVSIFWTTGACMMIRSDLFFNCGGFDESFFAHMEEIDLCWRMQNKGYSLCYVHQSTVFHLGGGTLSTISPRKTYLNFRNNLFLLYKNLPANTLLSTIFIRMVLDGLAFIRFIAIGNFSHGLSVFNAHMAFYKNLSNLRKSRRNNINNQALHQLKGVYHRSIVFEFYLKGKKQFNVLNKSKFSQ
ncbi:MAG: glycosyltransferase family 2 protein [Bacteroidia bacterium]|nr:glycosyltransferase family 2 protein [Bacteroidia bacterium]MCZ2247989.1 glycosyltransferase family 2 protein [Bacteroidia bacterium]